ncbi:MAG TPA: ketopantoate reductase C-terminal domain-containing protein, partial [Desulfurivibrionaceae bacterium]|nr:ketopantoate reductase C-terminal domain-containing protein [Desulfurivibrionaceae bacterium]
LEVCRTTATNISSMLQDVRKRRLTEIAAINGAVVAIAERLGIATPINRELTREIRALEQGVTPDFP